MPGARLSPTEREHIAAGLREGRGFAVIARRLGRPTSTVSREVIRNGGRSGYTAVAAERETRQRARRGRTSDACAATASEPTSGSGRPDPREVRRFAEHFARMLTSSGLLRMPARVLTCLLVSEHGALTARALRTELSVSAGAVSKAVRYLEAFGLVHRDRSAGRDVYRFSGDWGRTFERRDALFAPWEEGALQGARLLGPDTARGARFAELAHFMRIVRGTITQIRERWRRTAIPA